MEELKKFLVKELHEIARLLGIDCSSRLSKKELIELIEADINSRDGASIAWGNLEVMADGYGFLRNTNIEKDIYVSASQIRKFKLRTEDFVVGEAREPIQGENTYGLRKVLLINEGTTEEAEKRIPFY